ncbi:MAG: hypothetical protein DMG21_01225, partial [Acidobacteria bacterium]
NITDAISAVFGVSFLAALAGALLAWDGGAKRWLQGSIAFMALAAGIAVGNTVAGKSHAPPLRLGWTKEGREPPPLYERWNSFSRVTVAEDWAGMGVPNQEGLSSTCIKGLVVPHRLLRIDSSAETTLLEFKGDLKAVEYLKCDVKDAAFAIWPNRDVLVVGAGGGRDVLAALASDEKSVRAVEINANIIQAVNGRYGDYTGHLDRDPSVQFVNDEARSYIARSGERFGIIQISFIDTWAATAAGGFALTENSLYTLEAWNSMLNHLMPDGVLSVSRWYVPNNPLEAYRLVSLAGAALARVGANDPRAHLAVLAKVPQESPSNLQTTALTVLVGRSPFSETELARIRDFANRLGFRIILDPRSPADPLWAALASGRVSRDVLSSGIVDLSPPTDDRPFFFQMFRLGSAWRYAFKLDWINTLHAQAVASIFVLLIAVSVLSLACLILPLVWRAKVVLEPGALPFCVYFAAIGLGLGWPRKLGHSGR